MCGGSGRVAVEREVAVHIPAGADTGTRLRLAGEGEPGDSGAPRGDLYCDVAVRPHPFFERHGVDLVCQIPITYTQAALGAEMDIPTLEGPHNLTVPRTTEPGHVFRLRGKGVPDPRGYGRGDLLVQAVIEVPKRLTKRHEELLRELADMEQTHVSPERKSFLRKLREYFTAEESDGDQESER